MRSPHRYLCEERRSSAGTRVALLDAPSPKPPLSSVVFSTAQTFTTILISARPSTPELVPCSWTDLPAGCTRKPAGLLMPPVPPQTSKVKPMPQSFAVPADVTAKEGGGPLVTAAPTPNAEMDGEVATTAGAESSAPVESDGGIQQDEDTNEPTKKEKTMPEEEASQLPPSSGMASWLLMLALFPAIIGYALHNGFAPRNMDQLKALLGRATTEWSGRLLNSTESSRAAEADVKDEAADVVDVEPLSAPAKRGGRKTPAKSSTERAAASATTAPDYPLATLSKRGTLRTAEDDGDSTTHAGTETAYKISAGADGQVNVTPVRRTRRGKQVGAAESIVLLSPNNAISIVR